MSFFVGRTFARAVLVRLCAGLVLASLSCAASAAIAERAIRLQAAGIDLVVYPMQVRDVVSFTGSLPAGDVIAAREGSNPAVATLVAMMLDKGTTKQDKIAIANRLDDVGASIRFAPGPQMVTIHGRSLSKDLGLVIRLLAEQLRTPAFLPEELDRAKKQLEARVRMQIDDTGFRAREAFARAVYPDGHPNRPVAPQEWLAAAQRATVEELRAFHGKHYGPAHLTLVFAGDVDAQAIQAEIAEAFAGWTGGTALTRSSGGVPEREPSVQTVELHDKASVSIVLGQSTGLRFGEPGYVALSVGTEILGSGFTGRLMSTVRDKEGLTYGIGAGLSDDTFTDGSWSISATFAPELLERGIASTRRELEKWWREGVTAAELEARKSNLVGSFKVRLSTTGGMAYAILESIDRGVGIDWLDRYPEAVAALSVDEVNAAIRKYLDPQRMVLVKAGTMPAS